MDDEDGLTPRVDSIEGRAQLVAAPGSPLPTEPVTRQAMITARWILTGEVGD